MLKELREDYERHGKTLRNPAFWLLAAYRFGRWANDLPRPARKLGSAVYAAMLTSGEFVMGSTLHRETRIGKALHLIHADSIKIDPQAIIGDRVGIMHGVTIGRAPDRTGSPVIGDDVFIGAGAKILGPVKIGDRARVAANSLVVSDVPADATAIGVPAKIMRYTGRTAPVNGESVRPNGEAAQLKVNGGAGHEPVAAAAPAQKGDES